MTDERIEEILAAFRAWLRERPEEAEPEEFGLVDLADEFSALRHEVKLLTKAARAQSEQVAAALGSPPAAAVPAEDPRTLLLAVIEAVDTIDRARAALARAVAPRPLGWLARRFAPPPDERLPAAAEGLALSRQRVLAVLKRMGVEPVPAVDLPFDPRTMEALEAVRVEGATAGVVVEEIRTGYLRAGKILRYAQVRVAK